MIDQAEYTTITGDEPPEDFASCLSIAQEQIHKATFYAYTGDLRRLPRMVVDRLKAAAAYQVQHMHLMGGVQGVQMETAESASLGSYSYSGGGAQTGGSSSIAPAAAPFLPFLIAYARGMSQ